MNIEYIKTAFSADCSKNFDGKNMVQIMGKICPIYVPYFAHGVFTLKVSERFQFTLPYGEWPWMIRPSRPFNFNSHSYAGVTVAQVSTIIMALFQFALQYRSDYKISTKNHTFAWLFFLPCMTILAHKRAFFNINFETIQSWNL